MRHAGNHQSATDIDALGKQLGLQLPPGTQVVGVETESGIDDAVFAKLRIPTTRSAEFLKSCGVTRFESGAADLLGPDRGFWDPHQAKALKVGDVMLQSARGLVIGVDDAPVDALVVYVMNHGT